MSYKARTDPDDVIDGSICENSPPVDPQKDIVRGPEEDSVGFRVVRGAANRIVLPETDNDSRTASSKIISFQLTKRKFEIVRNLRFKY